MVQSVDNCRLFVGGLPRNMVREDVFAEMTKLTEEVVDVILYPSANDKSKNRGYAFVEYESHKAAAMARRKLAPGKVIRTVFALDNNFEVHRSLPERILP